MDTRAIAAALLSSFLTLGVFQSAGAQTPVIEWKVVNRFPLFPNERFQQIENEWRQVQSSATPMHLFLTKRMEGKKEPVLSAPEELRHAYRDGAYMRNYLLPSADARALVELSFLNASGPCSWKVPDDIRVVSVSGCTATIEVPRRGQTDVVGSAGVSQVSSRVKIREVLIAAFGDSYGSGEGNPDVPTLFDPQTPSGNDWFARGEHVLKGPKWLDPLCHRSMLSWPMLASIRIALQHPDAIVTVANYSCSGAKILDGFYLAQSNPPGAHALSDQEERDGAGPRYIGRVGKYVAKGQINALREDLCARPSLTSTAKDLAFAPYVASIKNCESFARVPDALLVSIGGNDVGFASAVKGLLMPNVARSAIPPLMIFTQSGLNLARQAAGAISADQLSANIQSLEPSYLDVLRQISKDAMVSPSKTVLLAYPDPVGGRAETCTNRKRQLRVKHANLAFAPFARAASPKIAHPFMNWAVEISREEVTKFKGQAYEALRSLQFQLVDYGFRVKDFTAANPYAFADRMLCTDQIEPDRALSQWALEPMYFCQGPTDTRSSDPDNCLEVWDEARGLNFLNRNLGLWRSHLPGRRLINSVNDSLLTQTRKPDFEYSVEELLLSSVTGAFHPVAEAHALGADSAYSGLCDALNTPSSRLVENAVSSAGKPSFCFATRP